MRTLVTALLGLVLLLLTAGRADAKEPTRVTTGIYINQIHELNLKENFFVVDAYVWFRWRGDDVKPTDSFSFIDGRIESKTETGSRKLPDGVNFAGYRIVVKVTKYWDVRQYPLDRHVLALAFEEDKEDINDIRYEADAENSGIGPGVRMPGYVITYESTKAGTGAYQSNFGDTSLPTGNKSEFARLTTSVALNREGSTYFAKLFFALWVASAIAFLSFFVKPTNVDPRFGLGVGAMFAAIASEYTVSSGLPEIGAATLADRLHVVAYAAIFITLAQSTVSLWLFEKGHEDRALRSDRQFSFGLPLVYAIANILVIALR